ncbi:hypothetical protein CH35J_004609 [Colletotrichum higginsianum]|uniref:Uncharacterized protein n=1 Tax=Colletotrichum higginsianum TaxID=80884 RepID=A0A4T0W9F1_9PEZI|nr:hypothetical protein CH35J_004609 [Colletotrichum higginsianum]
MDTSRDSSNLLDTHNRLIADVLSRFRMLTMLATIQAEGERKNAEPQTVAVTGMSMQMEFEGLVRRPYLSSRFPKSPPLPCLGHSFPSIVSLLEPRADIDTQHTSIKDLLALSRRLKELWLFGKLGRGEGDARIQADKLQADVVRCAELLNAIQESRYAGLASAAGGKWAPMGRPEAASANAEGAASAAAAAAAAAPPPANTVAAPNGNGNGAGSA